MQLFCELQQAGHIPESFFFKRMQLQLEKARYRMTRDVAE